MEAFTNLLQQIPHIVWAAIIASLLTLSGVLLTNWDNRKRLTAQLTHDSIQRDREREMAIRRDVYLAAAEAVAEAQERLGRIASMELQELGEKFSGTSLSPSINKIQLIASEKTVKAVSAFTQKYSESIMELFPSKLYLNRLQSELANIINEINGLLASREEMLQQLKTIPKTEENRTFIESVYYKFEESQKTIEALFQARDVKQALVGKVYYELLNESMAHSLAIGESLVDATIAIREELDIPIDEDFYRDLMSKRQSALKKNFDEYLKNVQESLTK